MGYNRDSVEFVVFSQDIPVSGGSLFNHLEKYYSGILKIKEVLFTPPLIKIKADLTDKVTSFKSIYQMNFTSVERMYPNSIILRIPNVVNGFYLLDCSPAADKNTFKLLEIE